MDNSQKQTTLKAIEALNDQLLEAIKENLDIKINYTHKMVPAPGFPNGLSQISIVIELEGPAGSLPDNAITSIIR